MKLVNFFLLKILLCKKQVFSKKIFRKPLLWSGRGAGTGTVKNSYGSATLNRLKM
jgi:hypothetical protein